MVWNGEKDELLCREVLLFEPYQFKERTRERGNAWRAIADNLNAITTHQFRVDSRAVRERFAHIIARFERSTKDDQKATGTSPEVTLLDQALQDITERMAEAEASLKTDSQNVKDKNSREKHEAEEIRQRAVENLGETRKRESQEGTSSKTPKKTRSSGSETLQYLREKSEKDQELKKQELLLKQQETSQQQNMFNTLMRQMQSQNEQMMAVMLKLVNDKNSK